MKIAGLQKVSLIDYPGRVAATVFLAGCNLNCGYCYNRWMIAEARVVAKTTVEGFLSWLGTRQGLLDGVCVSGGEPTLQPELPSFLYAIRDQGFAVKLDTNGTRPVALQALLEARLVDYVAMDLKAPLDARYQAVIGREVDLAAFRQSMQLLRTWGGEYEFRTTVCPQLDEQALEDIVHELQPGESWFLQLFTAREGIDPALAEAKALDEEALRRLLPRLSAAAHVEIRGGG